MMKKFTIVMLLSLSLVYSQDLTGVRICIDPGHGGTESDDRPNPEVGYYESVSNLVKGLALNEILQNLGAQVKMTRTGNNNTTDDPSLSQRVAIANSFTADYFQSIHSNAFSGTINYTLILFQGFDNGPTYSGAKTMADILGDKIQAANRTTSNYVRGDFDFYGTGKAYLGVFKYLGMPGTLSEGSFHDYRPETWRLMNPDYCGNEARSIARGFLQYYGKPGFTVGSLAGIIRDADSKVDYYAISSTGDAKAPVNNMKVSITPGDLVYLGDNMNNGYFCVDSLLPGSYRVVAEAPNYYSDTTTIDLVENRTNFLDFVLVSELPPILTSSSPTIGEARFLAWDILTFQFSRAMKRPLTEAAFSIDPEVQGAFSWSMDSKKMYFVPEDTLAFTTAYTININGSAEDAYGHFIDGNNDGIEGDGVTIQFSTAPADVAAPVVVQTNPYDWQPGIELRPVLTIAYDEIVSQSSFSNDLFSMKNRSSLHVVNTSAILSNTGQHSLISVYVLEDLLQNNSYSLKILPGMQDEHGNVISTTKYINFITRDFRYDTQNIDNFEDGLSSWYSDPDVSGSTVGSLTEITSVNTSTDISAINESSSTSMQLNYGWDVNTSGTKLIRQYLKPGTTPRNISFTSDKTLQAYVFGDGNGNKFRFCVDDAALYEVSPWYTVDWYGWRLVSWNMSVDSFGTWAGLSDGVLNGALAFDSFQLTYTDGMPNSGTYYIDELRLVELNTVAVDGSHAIQPNEFMLLQNYPNPFNPWTNIPFTLPERSDVSVDIYNLRGELVDHVLSGTFDAGLHMTRWNASGVASGVYLVSLESGGNVITSKLTVLK